MDFKSPHQRGVTGIPSSNLNGTWGSPRRSCPRDPYPAHEARLENPSRAMLRADQGPARISPPNAPRLIQIQIATPGEDRGLIIDPAAKERIAASRTRDRCQDRNRGQRPSSHWLAEPRPARKPLADKIQAMTEGVQVGRIYEPRHLDQKTSRAFRRDPSRQGRPGLISARCPRVTSAKRMDTLPRRRPDAGSRHRRRTTRTASSSPARPPWRSAGKSMGKKVRPGPPAGERPSGTRSRPGRPAPPWPQRRANGDRGGDPARPRN